MYCSNCGKKLDESPTFCSFCGHRVNGSQQKYLVTGIGIRFANLILDYIGFMLFAVIIGFIIGLLGFAKYIQGGSDLLLGFIIVVGYYLFFESIWQRTPAKWITKTKVVMRDGSKPNFVHILGRSFSRFIPFEQFSFLISPVGWHDSLSKTMVVPASYEAAEVQQIDIASTKTNSGANKPIILVVVIIVLIVFMGLMSSIVLLALNSARAQSRDAARLADVREMATAAELYYNDNNSYPPSLDSLTPNYIGNVPTAPTPNDGPCSAEQNNFQYTAIPDSDTGQTNSSYSLNFCLGEETGGFAAGVHTASPQGIN